jgi:hypothetical protein
MKLELVAGIISFLFTLMILSYIIGDNILYRVASYLFVGITAGYAVVTVWEQVLWPDLLFPLWGLISGLLNGKPTEVNALLLVVPLIFCMLILMKMSPQLEWMGGPAMGAVVGVGAAVAVGGAVLGTILPQIQATMNLPGLGELASNPDAAGQSLITGVMVLIGTVSTLIYFHFGAKVKPGEAPRRAKLIDIIAWVGRLFVSITFGVLFAGLYMAALTALVERIASLRNLFSILF